MRTVSDIEKEIIDLILQAEVCFDICKSIPTHTGPGETFLPFYYNLACSRGLIILHSLLISSYRKEITIVGYINALELEKNKEKILTFRKDIKKIKKSFEGFYTTHLRHKVVAHLDKQYKHEGFTCGYMLSETILDSFISIIASLKEVFYQFANYSKDNYLINIKEESDLIISLLEQKNQKKSFDL